MKPTQQEIIELAREAGIVFDERAMPYYERLVHLALDRFGAGGGEPVRYEFQSADGTWHPFIDAQHYENTVADGRWPIRALYTHPSPTDLQAEYERGLEDGFKEGWIECSKWAQRDDLIVDIGSPSYEACVSAVKALKGKQ